MYIKKKIKKKGQSANFGLFTVSNTYWAVLGKFKRYIFIWNTPFTDSSDWMLIEAVAVACRDNVAEPRLCVGGPPIYVHYCTTTRTPAACPTWNTFRNLCQRLDWITGNRAISSEQPSPASGLNDGHHQDDKTDKLRSDRMGQHCHKTLTYWVHGYHLGVLFVLPSTSKLPIPAWPLTFGWIRAHLHYTDPFDQWAWEQSSN